MTPSELCVQLVKAIERFRASVYLDPAGIPTIGYGHVVLPSETFDTISREEGEHLLAMDLGIAADGVRSLTRTIPLAQHEFDALVSFTFNLGTRSLKGSTLLGLLQQDAPRTKVAHEFRRWYFAKGKPLPGLLRRRIAEELLFLGGSPKSVLDIAERMTWS